MTTGEKLLGKWEMLLGLCDADGPQGNAEPTPAISLTRSSKIPASRATLGRFVLSQGLIQWLKSWCIGPIVANCPYAGCQGGTCLFSFLFLNTAMKTYLIAVLGPVASHASLANKFICIEGNNRSAK